jgi:membrane protein implicated in regulation of membrane protease activity
MGKTAIGFGVALIAIGVIGWLAGGMSSITGLIPALFGVVLAALGWWAGRGNEKTAMHIAAVVGLIGLLAPLGRIFPALGGGELGLAFWTNVLMFVVSGAFFALCVKSFVDARKARRAQV